MKGRGAPRSSPPFHQPAAPSADESAVRTLYQQVIEGWNQHSAETFASAFAEDGETIGFDGSQMVGRGAIATTLRQIFADHVTAPYVSKVRSVQLVSPEVALLRAIVGMVPPGQSDLNPALNAHQTLVATKRAGRWHIHLFQTTPAQFHGRPDLVQHLTEELQQVLT